MKNPYPEISLSRTATGALLHLRMEVPAGYVLQALPATHSATPEKITVAWVRSQESPTARMQELFVSLPPLPRQSIEVEVRDGDGRSVGGGVVVILEEADDK